MRNVQGLEQYSQAEYHKSKGDPDRQTVSPDGSENGEKRAGQEEGGQQGSQKNSDKSQRPLQGWGIQEECRWYTVCPEKGGGQCSLSPSSVKSHRCEDHPGAQPVMWGEGSTYCMSLQMTEAGQ